MAKYRSCLPQLGGDFFMTDGGIETTLIFLVSCPGKSLVLRSRHGRGVPTPRPKYKNFSGT